MKHFPLLGNLVMLVKQLLKVNQLNDPYSGGISSYALTLMIVAFLQFQIVNCGPGCLVYYLQYQPAHEDLAYTLVQFLHFYSYLVNFSNSVIQPLAPGDYTSNPIFNSFHLNDKLTIIDPLNQSNNVGKSSFNIQLIKECFMQTCSILSQNSPHPPEMYEEWKRKVLTV